MTIALSRPRPIFRSTAVPHQAPEGSVRLALTELRSAIKTSTIGLAQERRAELRRSVTKMILLERSVLAGDADLSSLANPAVTGDTLSVLADTLRSRALGRVMNQLIGEAPTDASNGWWIPTMSEIIGERPGLHMDARDALTSRFDR